LAIKFSEEVLFMNDQNRPFFFARDFVKAFYINMQGYVHDHDIIHDQVVFEERLIDMQLELMEGMDYELYVSEETYKQYSDTFVWFYRQSQLDKKQKKSSL
jgi:hypothetical protein